MATAKPVDLELKQAFYDLQVQMVETKKSIDSIDQQLGLITRMQMHTALTKRGVDSLPTDTKTYESLARMFVVSDLGQIKENLEQKTQTLNDRVEKLNNRKVFLNNTLNESEANIRDLIQQKKIKTDTKPALDSEPASSKK